MFEAIHSRLERISQYAVWVGGAALLAAAVMVTVDVFARKFFSITMSGSDEYSGYVFSATTTMAYSYCLLHRSNVRIDALYNLMPRWLTGCLDVIGLSLLLYYMSIMSYYAVISFADSWVNNSVSITTLGTPQWIPQLFWLFGLALFFCYLNICFYLFPYSTSATKLGFSSKNCWCPIYIRGNAGGNTRHRRCHGWRKKIRYGKLGA